MRRLIGLFLLVVPESAWAHPAYPEVFQLDLELRVAPPCSLCHLGGVGTRRTATRPFVKTLMAYGLGTESEPETLSDVVVELDRCNVDTDADGVRDIDELKRATDPSDGPGPLSSDCEESLACGSTRLPILQYGCALQRAAPSAAAGVWIAAAAAAFAFRRRRRSAWRPAAYNQR